MGSKRVGLARLERLLENLNRDIDFTGSTLTDIILTTSKAVTLSGATTINGITIDSDIPFELQGLASPWTLNFGGDQVAGLATAPTTANVLTEPVIALKCSRVLEQIADASAVPSANWQCFRNGCDVNCSRHGC